MQHSYVDTRNCEQQNTEQLMSSFPPYWKGMKGSVFNINVHQSKGIDSAELEHLKRLNAEVSSRWSVGFPSYIKAMKLIHKN